MDVSIQLDIIFKSIDAFSIESALASSKSIYMHSCEMLSVLNVKSNYTRTQVPSSHLYTENYLSHLLCILFLIRAYQLSIEDILMPYDSLYDFGEMGTVHPADSTLKPVLLVGADTSLLGSCPNFHDVANSRYDRFEATCYVLCV